MCEDNRQFLAARLLSPHLVLVEKMIVLATIHSSMK